MLRRHLLLSCAFAALLVPATADAADPCTVPAKLGVAFSLDDSGSMVTSDPDKLRLEATRAGMDQMPDGAVVAVSSFDTYSRSQIEPTVLTAANREELKGQVWGSAGGQTDYQLGFEKAKEQLEAMTGTDKRALIFLSDGIPSYSYYANDDIAAQGIPIYTIGFNDAPPAVLADIAAESGGQAFTVQSPGQAQAVFARIISSLTCDASKFTGQAELQPGETRGFPFAVAPDDGEYKALAAWYGGDVSVTITRPDGTVMAPGALHTGESFVDAATYSSIDALNPPAGAWTLNVTASPDNFSNVSVSIDVWKRALVLAHPLPAPPPPPPPALKVDGVGDSIAAGFGLDLSGISGEAKLITCAAQMPVGDCDSPSKAWPSLAANMLPAAVTAGRPVSMTNYAVSGTTTTDWLAGRKTSLAQAIADKPDVVLMTLGANNLLQNPQCLKDITCVYKLIPESKKVIQRELPEVFRRLLAASPSTNIWITNYYNVPLDKVGLVAGLNSEIRMARQSLGSDASRVHVAAAPKLAGSTCHAGMPYLLGGKDLCTHPNAAGTQLIARAVINAMNGAAPPDGNAKSSRLSSLDVVTPVLVGGATVAGVVVVKVTSAVGNATRNVTGKFVRGVKGLLRADVRGAHAAKTRSKTYIVHGTVRYTRGVATLRLKVPKGARVNGTKLYLKLGVVEVAGKRQSATKFVQVATLGH